MSRSSLEPPVVKMQSVAGTLSFTKTFARSFDDVSVGKRLLQSSPDTPVSSNALPSISNTLVRLGGSGFGLIIRAVAAIRGPVAVAPARALVALDLAPFPLLLAESRAVVVAQPAMTSRAAITTPRIHFGAFGLLFIKSSPAFLRL